MGKENENKGYSNTSKHEVPRSMLGRKETMEGDSQPPSPVGTEGSLSTDNTNNQSSNQSLHFHSSEDHKINQHDMSRPPQDLTCSTLTMGSGTSKQIIVLPQRSSAQIRLSENVKKKKLDRASGNTNSSVATLVKSNIEYNDNKLKIGVTNRVIDSKKEGNNKIQKTTKVEYPTTPKRTNRIKSDDICAEDFENISMQDDLEVVMHYKLPSGDGTAKRKKKNRSRVPFFGRWNSVEYMQCHEEDFK